MKLAAESEGADRQRLIQLALAWQQLARGPCHEQAGLADPVRRMRSW